MTANLSVRQFSQAFIDETESGAMGNVGIARLLHASANCVRSLDGRHRILASAVSSFLYYYLDYLDGSNTPDAPPFMQYGHQPISDAIVLLQGENIDSPQLENALLSIISAHEKLIV